MPLRIIIMGTTLLCMAFTMHWRAHQSESHHSPLDRADLLHQLAHALEDDGMVYRPDMALTVSGQPAAWGFSAQDCHGVLLLAVLPDTAQSWSHISPELEPSGFRASYLYRGAVYSQVPVWRRLYDRIRSNLHTHPNDTLAKPVIGLAEYGACSLTQRAAQLVINHLHSAPIEHHKHAFRNSP